MAAATSASLVVATVACQPVRFGRPVPSGSSPQACSSGFNGQRLRPSLIAKAVGPTRKGKQQQRRRGVQVQALLDPREDEILANVIKEPVAFFGGVVAGLLRLDLTEEPLRDWVKRTSEAAGVKSQLPRDDGGVAGGADVESFDDEDDDSQPLEISIE